MLGAPYAADLAFVLRFLAVFLVLQLGYYAIPEATLHAVVIHLGTVRPSAALVNLLSPGEGVSAVGNRLASGRAALDVIRGCDGSGSLFLLIAAVAAFRADWRHKLLGLSAAAGLMLVLNQVRIVALYFVVAREPAWFDYAHTYLAPTLAVAAAALFFAWWVLGAAPVRPRDDARAG